MPELLAQVTLGELLQDPMYRKFFTTVPKLSEASSTGFPWRVYIQRSPGGPWGKKDFHTYPEAFRFLRDWMKRGIHDAAIVSRRKAFDPPVRWARLVKDGKPVWELDPQTKKPARGPDGKQIQKVRKVTLRLPAGHDWCPHCRRPTTFNWYAQHHAFPSSSPLAATIGRARRCSICGISETGIHWRGGDE